MVQLRPDSHKNQIQLVVFLGLTGIRLMTLAVLTGFARAKSKKFLAPEDAKRFGVEAQPMTSSGTMDPADRAMRVHYNALENDIIWLMAALAMFFAGANINAQIILNTIYTAARVGHAIFYLFGVRPPFRGICFGVGLFTCLTMFLYAIGQSIKNKYNDQI
jgi:uncharacterized MAPEG superfamily protein